MPDRRQPFYVNAPTLRSRTTATWTNADDLRHKELYADTDCRHLNDDERLRGSSQRARLSFPRPRAARSKQVSRTGRLTQFARCTAVRVFYACVTVIAGKGMLAFRDPCGIRPIGAPTSLENGFTEYMVSSESVTMIGLGFKTERDLEVSEAMWIDLEGNALLRSAPTSPRFIRAPRVRLLRPSRLHDRRHQRLRRSSASGRDPRRPREGGRRPQGTSTS